MTVTLLPADFVQPTGSLDALNFPNEDLLLLVSGWLVQAAGKVALASSMDVLRHDEAASAWVYHRAYRHIADRLMLEPQQASLESGISRTVGADQRKYFATLAASYLSEFEALIPVAVTTPTLTSYSVPLRAVW